MCSFWRKASSEEGGFNSFGHEPGQRKSFFSQTFDLLFESPRSLCIVVKNKPQVHLPQGRTPPFAQPSEARQLRARVATPSTPPPSPRRHPRSAEAPSLTPRADAFANTA